MAKFTGHTITSDSALGSAKIQKSLRFNRPDDVKLQRTATTTSNTFTYSTWVKRSSFSTFQYLLSIGGQGLLFNTDDTIRVYSDSGANASSAKFRDPNAWYHVVLSMNSGSATVYVNNVTHLSSVSGFSLSTSTNYLKVGWLLGDPSQFTLDGYLAETQLIDGSALTPSSFGFTDPVTGIWMPKRYEGTYGTSGFYLDFSDNSSTAALGIDKSPNGNDFSVTNFSITAGVGNDSLLDTPTNNFCTLNPLSLTATGANILNGNLDYKSDSNYSIAAGNFTLKTGKWYWEVTITAALSGSNGQINGIVRGEHPNSNAYVSYDTNGNVYGIGYVYNGSIQGSSPDGSTNAPGGASGLATYTEDDVLGFASDIANGTLAFYKNGSLQHTITGLNSYDWFPAGSGYGTSSTNSFNFGQRPFVYTPPLGHQSLCSNNLLPASKVVRPQRNFDILLWTGNGGTQTLSGLEFAPDLVWIKSRSSSINHQLIDTVRGATKRLQANQTTEEKTNTNGLTAFTPDGFSVGDQSNVNGNSLSLVGWCWKAGGAAVSNSDGSVTSQVSANLEAGFSIVSYTATGSAGATVGHGLGKKPDFILSKRLNDQSNWGVYHSSRGAGKSLFLNLTNAEIDNPTYYNDTEPTSTVFTLGGSNESNGLNGDTYIAYCWTEIPGYSKFGTFIGNGSSDGAYVKLGFRPALILLKRTSSANWTLWDNKRDSYNPIQRFIYTDLNNGEGSGTDRVDFVSDGIKWRNSNTKWNASGGEYVYMAWAEQTGTTPFRTSTNSR